MTDDSDRTQAQRRAATRTALWLALVAGALYVGFFLSGVYGRVQIPI